MIKKEIAEKLFKAELAQEKVELGITQDIQSDLDSVSQSVKSVRRVMIDAEVMLGKNAKALVTIKKAIDRVEKVAKEIGADEVIKVVQKQKTNVNELESNISKAIVGLGNAMQHIV